MTVRNASQRRGFCIDTFEHVRYRGAVPRVAVVHFAQILQQGIEAMAAAGDDTFFEGVTSADDLPFGVPDEVVTAASCYGEQTAS